MKKEGKVIALLFFITLCALLISCMRAGAVVLRQVNGELVTASGQLVEFVGTNGFSGINTPTSHQNDPTDTWMVMQVEGDHALIAKQNPIAMQTYGDSGAIYNQSNIKNSVDAWYHALPPIEIHGVDFREYVSPVRLEGASQSSPNGYNLVDQMNYKSVVDQSGPRVAFVPSLIDVNRRVNGTLDAGKSSWQSFASVDLATVGSVGRALNQMWLRSPLNSPLSTAAIGNDGNISYNNKTSVSKLTLRPACWVRVREAAPPRLMQKNGQPVTACGQIVEFVGTSSFSGVNTPPEHQADLIDDYMVMQIEEGAEGKRALIMKKNPIAVQKYKDGGTEARYDQSDIKVSVDTWYRGLPPTRINGLDFHEYILPVVLEGASQSSPNGYNLADQSCYKTVVDLQRGVKMAFVPSLVDVDTRVDNTFAARDNWMIFMSDFPDTDTGDLHFMNATWLGSPLSDHRRIASAAFISTNTSNSCIFGKGSTNCATYINGGKYGVRPTYWVKI
jgi:hypothetical protein